MMFQYVKGCSDTKLQEKLCKIENPTLEAMDREVRAYERTVNSVKSMDGANSTAKAAKVSNGKAGNKGKGKGKTSNGSNGQVTKKSL